MGEHFLDPARVHHSRRKWASIFAYTTLIFTAVLFSIWMLYNPIHLAATAIFASPGNVARWLPMVVMPGIGIIFSIFGLVLTLGNHMLNLQRSEVNQLKARALLHSN